MSDHTTQYRASVLLLALTAKVLALGCAGNTRVELAAADSMELLGESMTQAIAEYHADLARFDEERRRAAVQALIVRLRADIADDRAADAHAAAFAESLRRLDADQQAAHQRYAASLENVATLREVADGLRRLALESMSLDDDVRRYFGEMMERRDATKETNGD